jgi:four helix bundle protein
MISSFKEIQVWKKSHELVLEIYKYTKRFPQEEAYGLVSQMRRSAVSVPSNIAEGFKRKSPKEAVHFYNIAESSLEELKYQTLLSHDLNYMSDAEFKDLSLRQDEVGKMLNAWKKSQNK